ncbi:hypothetical protein [Actinomycetospora termitidis]|uniref:Uncharacterized protein n=1 Tax=Actinomycetospora termitidis TaxID=3053470 RepID=A0ABT7M6H7_9PSEU|nr:hypothetical protein [Actinomycetospora sp. Odt1-22]MDL5155849.1 hypothetical protein [Actinomycetospora sp. Odt1-22]
MDDRAPDRVGDTTRFTATRTVQDLVDDVLADQEGLEDRLDSCDAYVVLVADPATGALDSYGPFDGPTALFDAERRRQELDQGDLDDVGVTVVRHHLPHPGDRGRHAVA